MNRLGIPVVVDGHAYELVEPELRQITKEVCYSVETTGMYCRVVAVGADCLIAQVDACGWPCPEIGDGLYLYVYPQALTK